MISQILTGREVFLLYLIFLPYGKISLKPESSSCTVRKLDGIRTMIKTAEDFGRLVREKRKELGWTQEQLAAAVGSGERFIVDLENGKPSCQLEKALLAARSVGIELGDIKKSVSDEDEDDELRFIPRY